MKLRLLKITLCAMALLPMGAWADDVTWTFNNWSSATKTALSTDAAKNANAGDKWINNGTSGIYNYYAISKDAAVDNVEFFANGNAISEMTTTLGTLSFFFPKNDNAGRIRIDTRDNKNALYFVSGSEKVNIPGLTAGKKVSIRFRTSDGNKSIKMNSGNSNVVAYNQAAESATERTDVFIVNSSVSSATTVAFNASGTSGVSGVNIFYITVSDATAEELAKVNFGNDDVVTATTLWTFDQYATTDVLTTSGGVLNYSGLYMKPHASGTENGIGASARTSTFGTASVSTAKYCDVKGGHVFTAADILSRKASTGIADAMAINIGTPGKLYIEGSLGAANRRIEVYEGNGLSNLTAAISALKKGTLTATGAWSDESVLEVTITEPGSYWISASYTDGSNGEKGSPHRIHSIMFVPTTATAMTKNVTIPAVEWATFSAPQNYTVPEGVTAYYVSSTDGSKAVLTSIDAGSTIPACTGVLLYKEGGGDITLTSAESATAIGTNYLKANLAAYTIDAVTGVANYVLVKNASNSNKVEFVKIGATSAALGAGKSYLQIVTPSSPAPAFYSIGLDNNSVTGISQPVVKDVEDGAYYNLMGQRVDHPTKGIYIHNGKKVYVK